MSSWRERARSRREVESLRMLREILSAPNLKSKRAVVAQYNPWHYIFGEVRDGYSKCTGYEEADYGLSQ